eukprot:g9000.t1
MTSLTTAKGNEKTDRIRAYSVDNLSNDKRSEYKIHYETINGKKTLVGEFTYMYNENIKGKNVNKHIMNEIVDREVLKGFIKNVIVNMDSKVRIEMKWEVPKIISTFTRLKHLVGEVEALNDIESGILTVSNKNSNLLNFGTFHELGTYTLLPNECIKYHIIVKVTKPYIVPFSMVEYYGIKYLNFCWQNRENENKQLLLSSQHQQNGSNDRSSDGFGNKHDIDNISTCYKNAGIDNKNSKAKS